MRLSSVKKLLIIFGSVFLCLGFRLLDKERPWKVSNSSAAKTKVFVTYDHATRELTDNLPSSDPLAGTAPLTVTAAMNSVFNDYNGVAGAFVTLVDSSDGDFAAESANRIITIRNESTDGLTGGMARFEVTNGEITGCTISLPNGAYKDAKTYIGTVTHEMGHCMGLDHPQDTVHAIMSYFTDYSQDFRLQIDDKMGLVYLYPENPSKAKEDPTFGLSCERR